MSSMREHLGSQASTVMRQYADHLLYDGNLTEVDLESLDEALEAAKQVIEAIEAISVEIKRQYLHLIPRNNLE